MSCRHESRTDSALATHVAPYYVARWGKPGLPRSGFRCSQNDDTAAEVADTACSFPRCQSASVCPTSCSLRIRKLASVYLTAACWQSGFRRLGGSHQRSLSKARPVDAAVPKWVDEAPHAQRVLRQSRGKTTYWGAPLGAAVGAGRLAASSRSIKNKPARSSPISLSCCTIV